MASDSKDMSKLHRGAGRDMGAFAASFVRARLGGFEKDMKICLTPIARGNGKDQTHA